MSAFKPGDRLARFTISEKLGAGGTAEVYRAYDSDRGADVVLKIVPEDLDQKTLKRFVAETRILSRLNHPNVVKIYEVGQADGKHFYVMEYIEAKSLKTLIDTRCSEDNSFFDNKEVLAIFADIASALRYTHAQNIFHRDIKPGNILVDLNFKAILMDYGLAKGPVCSVQTESGILLGTPLYMSPEQLQGKKADHLSDIYSLGLVMYQMVVGHMPFESNNPYTSATRRLTENIPPPSTVNPTVEPLLEKIILKCLARDKIKRYQNASQLLAALHAVPGFPEHKRTRASTDDLQDDVPTIESKPTVLCTEKARALFPFGGGDRESRSFLFSILLFCFALLVSMAVTWVLTSDDTIEYVYGALTVVSSTTSVDISFRTTPALRSEIIYWNKEKPATITVISTEPKQDHHCILNGLPEGCKMKYRLRFIGKEGRLVETGEHSFKTTATNR